MNKILKSIIIFFIVVAAFKYALYIYNENSYLKFRERYNNPVSHPFSKSLNIETIDTSYFIKQVIDSLNKSLPLVLDKITTTEKVELIKDKLLKISCSLNLDTAKYNMSKVKALTNKLMLQNLLADTSYKIFSDFLVTVEYDFYLKREVFCLVVSISPMYTLGINYFFSNCTTTDFCIK